MNDDRRRRSRRGDADRRQETPSAAIDVTRLEHENLYGQVVDNVRALRRIEDEVHTIRELLDRRTETLKSDG